MRLSKSPPKMPRKMKPQKVIRSNESATLSVTVIAERDERVSVLTYPSAALSLGHPELVVEMVVFPMSYTGLGPCPSSRPKSCRNEGEEE